MPLFALMRTECEEKSGWRGMTSGLDTDTMSAAWQLIDGQCNSHIRDLKVQRETEVSPPQASPKNWPTSVKCRWICLQDDAKKDIDYIK